MTTRSVTHRPRRCCWTALLLLLLLLTAADGEPQFTNLRIFKSSRTGGVQARSNSAQRLSIGQLLQRLEANHLSKNVIAGSSATPIKESVVKRIAMVSGAATLKPPFTRFAALNKTLPTTSKYPTEPTTISTTPTTSSTPTTSTTQSTPRSPAATRQTTPTASIRGRTPAAPMKMKNGALSVAKSQLKHLPNSPIYYIKLPASGYSFVGGSASPASALPANFPHLHLPIDFSSNGKPSAIYLANGQPTTSTTPATTPATTSTTTPATTSTTLRTPLTDSRIIYIKGNFNGKPDNVYWQQAPYRPPTYWDFLHSLYPKLRRTQLI